MLTHGGSDGLWRSQFMLLFRLAQDGRAGNSGLRRGKKRGLKAYATINLLTFGGNWRAGFGLAQDSVEFGLLDRAA